MKKFSFSDSEMNVMLVSLIQRRNDILGLSNNKVITGCETLTKIYADELATVENLLEKFFPGSVERIKASSAA